MPVVGAPETGLRRRDRAPGRSHAPGRSGAPGRPRAVALPRPGMYVAIAAVSVALAALSLLLQASPAYDPWAWIIWGREIVHLGLTTTGGPTWKPLPVLFTTAFSPFGGAAPGLWLVVARAGGIMAVALAAVLAGRLTRCGAGRAAPALAGALAGAGLLTLYQFGAGVATGESEGLLAALMLLAILRHRDGAFRHALALGFAAALLRPETWPFMGLYGAWLWRRDPGARKLVVGLFAMVPLLWFLPELWGSGTLTRGVQWARYPRQGSAAFATCPFCSELSGTAWPLVTMPFKVGLGLALVPIGRGRAIAGVALLGVAWIVEEAVLTQLGFSGSDRYLVAPVALLIVAGAAGWGMALSRPQVALSGAAIALALSVVAFGRGPHFTPQFSAVRDQGRIRAEMQSAIAQAGGARRLVACGAIQTNPSEAPLAAWALDVPLRRTESSRGNVVIQSLGAASRAPGPLRPAGHRLVAEEGSVRIFVRCGGG
jgi:hypothetical protein